MSATKCSAAISSSTATSVDLAAGAVSVWCADLDLRACTHPEDRALLDRDELQRADRLHTAALRARFTAAHGFLRELLGGALDRPPRGLRFARAQGGKPHLACQGENGLRFNLSRRERLVLIALSTGAEVGVDVERVRALPDRDFVAAEVFGVRERASLATDPRGGDRAFFEAWARKESLVKATGEGLAAPLRQIEILREGPDSDLCAVRSTDGSTSLGGWVVRDLQFAPEFAAALATPRGIERVYCYSCNGEGPQAPTLSDAEHCRGATP